VPVAKIPAKRGLAYPDIIEGAVAGKIRALWIIGTNPLVSFPNIDALKQADSNISLTEVQRRLANECSKIAAAFSEKLNCISAVAHSSTDRPLFTQRA
jgi:predicted molibdopterin-dependent oxidoreductase YjgC